MIKNNINKDLKRELELKQIEVAKVEISITRDKIWDMIGKIIGDKPEIRDGAEDYIGEVVDEHINNIIEELEDLEDKTKEHYKEEG